MYRRVLLKLSGEALGRKDEPVCFKRIEAAAGQLIEAQSLGVELGVVLGGGNIWRGRSSGEMNRNRADHMGMLSTAINAIAMQDTLIQMGFACTVLSAADMPRFCESFTARLADALLSEKQIVIFACGTGHPFFSTDTAAALRAAEIGADMLLLAKNVDAVYSDDPRKNDKALRYRHIGYKKVIEDGLNATDLTAITLCRERRIPIHCFGLMEKDAILRAVKGEDFGTRIDEDEKVLVY